MDSGHDSLEIDPRVRRGTDARFGCGTVDAVAWVLLASDAVRDTFALLVRRRGIGALRGCVQMTIASPQMRHKDVQPIGTHDKLRSASRVFSSYGAPFAGIIASACYVYNSVHG